MDGGWQWGRLVAYRCPFCDELVTVEQMAARRSEAAATEKKLQQHLDRHVEEMEGAQWPT